MVCVFVNRGVNELHVALEIFVVKKDFVCVRFVKPVYAGAFFACHGDCKFEFCIFNLQKFLFDFFVVHFFPL